MTGGRVSDEESYIPKTLSKYTMTFPSVLTVTDAEEEGMLTSWFFQFAVFSSLTDETVVPSLTNSRYTELSPVILYQNERLCPT